MILGPYAKLGGVKFSHLDHTTKNRSVDGTKPIACVSVITPRNRRLKRSSIHHTRLSGCGSDHDSDCDLLEKDASAPPVNACTDCHARAGMKPKLLPDFPKIKVASPTGHLRQPAGPSPQLHQLPR